ncbi:MAG: helix-turn-helix transcriptional regulator [Phycisphaerales bacterium]|nr:helix-turn-helix transcriptional regulator [Phycisphaerales bacterium]
MSTTHPHNTGSHHTQTNARRLTNSLLSIASLPSAPTYDWTTRAAKSLSRIHPNITLGLAVAIHNTQHARVTAESTGVMDRCDTPDAQPANTQPIDLEHARSALDRIDATPIQIPRSIGSTGYITAASKLLPSWFSNPLSEPWNANQFLNTSRTIAAYAPITPTDPLIATSLTRIPCLIAFAQTDTTSTLLDPVLLAEALSALAFKARSTFDIDALAQHQLTHDHFTGFSWLTLREQTILDHLLEGKSVRVIAECIGRSPHTVHDHVKNLHRKLNASSRGQLIARSLGRRSPLNDNDLPKITIDPELIEPTNQQAIQQPNQSPAPELKLTQTHNNQSPPQRLRATPLNRRADQSRAAL